MSQPPNQYQPPKPAGQPAPPKSGAGKTIMIVGGVIGLVCLCCCGGIAGFMWFGFGQLTNLVADQYGDKPAVSQNIGDDMKVSINWKETGERSKDGTSRLAFDVEGSSGKGIIVCEQVPGSQSFTNGILITSSGEEIPLD